MCWGLWHIGTLRRLGCGSGHWLCPVHDLGLSPGILQHALVCVPLPCIFVLVQLQSQRPCSSDLARPLHVHHEQIGLCFELSDLDQEVHSVANSEGAFGCHAVAQQIAPQQHAVGSVPEYTESCALRADLRQAPGCTQSVGDTAIYCNSPRRTSNTKKARISHKSLAVSSIDDGRDLEESNDANDFV